MDTTGTTWIGTYQGDPTGNQQDTQPSTIGEHFIQGGVSHDGPKEDRAANNNGNGLHGLDSHTGYDKGQNFGRPDGHTGKHGPHDAFIVALQRFRPTVFP
eukprot:scaffold1538_cov158-Amphora_coffeaeformis.AAC.2